VSLNGLPGENTLAIGGCVQPILMDGGRWGWSECSLTESELQKTWKVSKTYRRTRADVSSGGAGEPRNASGGDVRRARDGGRSSRKGENTNEI